MSFVNFSYITKEKGGYAVKSEKGKNLGSGYKSKSEAEDRLAEVEMFKHMKNKKAFTARENSVNRFHL